MNYIQLSETGYFSKIILDYIQNKNELKPFYGDRPDAKNLIFNAGKKKFEKSQRDLLHDVLTNQYSKCKISEKRNRNIEALKEANTFTITTGHQLNFFTGPVYFIYKIVQAIKLAEQLSKQDSTINYVPVYWMASEDHDQEEINHANILGQRFEWPVDGNDAAGHISSDRTNSALTELKELLIKFNFPDDQFDWIIASYQNSKTLSEACRSIVDHLFADHGLIIIDADDMRLKRSFAHIMQEDLEHEISSVKVLETIKEFPSEYKIQVNPRSINLFYLFDNSRDRIIKAENGSYFSGEKKIAQNLNELISILKDHPERFSPNVVLRPVYQEFILPNLAYIGGAGELSYWFEYKKMFDHFQIDFPVLILRNSFLMIDHGARKKLDKLGITNAHLFNNTDLLIREFVKEEDGDKLSFASQIIKIDQVFSELMQKAKEVDPTLEASFDSEKQKQFKLLHQLEDKLIRVSKKKHETEVNQIRGLKEKLFPGNSLQERHDNFLNFYLKHPNWLSELMEQIEPLKMEFGIMELN